MGKKRLQVFVSSTYEDLKTERQAAVQAILTAGHIPAGMELFAAGDQEQMEVIKDWIDESDVFMLILGHRYGSIEPKSEKSYIELEYEYALSIRKPLFTIVAKDGEDFLQKRIQQLGTMAIERQNPEKFDRLKKLVQTPLVRFWEDSKDIKLATLESLNRIASRENLIGWVRGDEASSAKVANTISSLLEENNLLKARLDEKNSSKDLNGLSFDEMKNVLKDIPVSSRLVDLNGKKFTDIQEVIFKHETETLRIYVECAKEKYVSEIPNLLHAFLIEKSRFPIRGDLMKGSFQENAIIQLEKRGLVSITRIQKNQKVVIAENDFFSSDGGGYYQIWSLSETGKRFANLLDLEMKNS